MPFNPFAYQQFPEQDPSGMLNLMQWQQMQNQSNFLIPPPPPPSSMEVLNQKQ